MLKRSGGLLGTLCLSSSQCTVPNSECAMHMGTMLCVCMYGFVALGADACQGKSLLFEGFALQCSLLKRRHKTTVRVCSRERITPLETKENTAILALNNVPK